MNHRSARESLIGARNYPAAVLSQHRRGHSMNLAGANNRNPVSDESHLDLFSKNRRSLSVTSSDESSDVSVKLGRLSVGSAKISRSGIDDLLSAAEGGKHDYDWLLTPPGTPTMFHSSEGNEPQRVVEAPRGSSLARSASTTKASRLSVSHSENNHPSRPARSSSVTRSSTSNSMYSAYTSNRSSTILNTSSASVSSYTRSSSPMTRSSSSTARPSTPSSRPSLSRPTTPSRARPAPINTPSERTRTGQQSSRPSTPSSRPQIPANLTSRTASRPSTPIRRSSVPSLSPASSPSLSASSRAMSSNGRTTGPQSRPSSPSPRLRPHPHPVVPPDFPLDTPPNLRTTLPPDRPVSAGRSRPGAASSVTPRGQSESAAAASNPPRRHSSPIVARGRVTAPEPTGRARLHSGNGHLSDHEPRKGGSHGPDMSLRRPAKSTPSLTVSADATGFGRNISKKSLDMAIRHMDIRNGGSVRPLSGTSLFPQSIRSVAPKSYSLRGSNSLNAGNGGLQASYNGLVLENGNGNRNVVHKPGIKNGADQDRRNGAKLSEVDIYESSRYDAILLKEDLKNTNWLHSIDDQTDSGSMFDHGFESLPEPFGLL